MIPIPFMYTISSDIPAVTPDNIFVSGPYGSTIFIPVDRPVEVKMVGVSDTSKYLYVDIQTPSNFNSVWSYGGFGVMNDKTDYVTFDFLTSHPTINIPSYSYYIHADPQNANQPVNGYVWGYLGGTLTFSTVKMLSYYNTDPPYTGKQVICFNLLPNTSITLAPYQTGSGQTYYFKTKAFLYHMDSVGDNLIYSGLSYSNVGLEFRNENGNFV